MGKLSIPANGLILFLVSLAILLTNLGKPMIYILDEAKNAECAREMLVSGDYIVPYFNGQLRTDKPPLHYFFMVLSYKIFGVSAFSARFFSAVFGALTILISFLFCRKYLGQKAAWLSALVLLASIHFNFQMRLAVPDPYLIFFMTAAFMSFYLFMSGRQKMWLWLMYISFGLGLLVKGPVALGLPGLIMLVYLLLSRQLSWRLIRAFRIPAGILIVLAIALPWYWMNYTATNGEWTEGFFLKHNLQRFSDPMEGHGGFFLLPLIMVIAGLLPLGFFSIQAMLLAYKDRSLGILVYMLCIVAGIILFFSFSQTKLPNYTTPAYPFLAIITGYLLSKAGGPGVSFKGLRWAYMVYSLVAIALPLTVYFVLKADPAVSAAAGVWVWFIALPLALIPGWYFLSSRKIILFILSIGLSFILTNIFFFSRAYPEVYSINPVAGSLELVKPQQEMVYYKMINPAYIFNLQRIIPMISTADSLKDYMKEHPGALLISRKQYEDEILQAIGMTPFFEQRDTFEKPVTVIYRLVPSSSASPAENKDQDQQ